MNYDDCALSAVQGSVMTYKYYSKAFSGSNVSFLAKAPHAVAVFPVLYTLKAEYGFACPTDLGNIWCKAETFVRLAGFAAMAQLGSVKPFGDHKAGMKKQSDTAKIQSVIEGVLQAIDTEVAKLFVDSETCVAVKSVLAVALNEGNYTAKANNTAANLGYKPSDYNAVTVGNDEVFICDDAQLGAAFKCLKDSLAPVVRSMKTYFEAALKFAAVDALYTRDSNGHTITGHKTTYPADLKAVRETGQKLLECAVSGGEDCGAVKDIISELCTTSTTQFFASVDFCSDLASVY